ncbi:MAG: prephenate dehydratase [Deferribacteraceae bacterium]|jgi:chorismate mutase/prephenate dehydratase|nr:prephenate dehydratase [Deferribacteraceae bacterium]
MSDENKIFRLDILRTKIDAVDERIIALLGERAALSVKVGEAKKEFSLPVFRPERESALLERITEFNARSLPKHTPSGVEITPLPKEHLISIYKEILSSSRALQEDLSIAYLGPEGTFSHIAALDYLGESLNYISRVNLTEVFEAVEREICHYGVVPFENSAYGTVIQSLDMFLRHNVHIHAEWENRITLSLMSKEAELYDIKAVYSHRQPLGQAAKWLTENTPGAKQISLESTSQAAVKALNEAGAAVVGHYSLASRYNLNVLARDIEDVADNRTRFFLVSAKPPIDMGADKSSLVFAVSNKPGGLKGVIEIFYEKGVNISKLESRPMQGGAWNYIFFMDVECCILDKEFTGILKLLSDYCLMLRVLGVYRSYKKE